MKESFVVEKIQILNKRRVEIQNLFGQDFKIAKSSGEIKVPQDGWSASLDIVVPKNESEDYPYFYKKINLELALESCDLIFKKRLYQELYNIDTYFATIFCRSDNAKFSQGKLDPNWRFSIENIEINFEIKESINDIGGAGVAFTLRGFHKGEIKSQNLTEEQTKEIRELRLG
jgi:hypothetical protein